MNKKGAETIEHADLYDLYAAYLNQDVVLFGGEEMIIVSASPVAGKNGIEVELLLRSIREERVK